MPLITLIFADSREFNALLIDLTRGFGRVRLTRIFNKLLTKLLFSARTMFAMFNETLTIESLPGPTDGQRVLRLIGPIVLTTFFEFQRVVREDSSSMLILDFHDVPYVDSAGIGALTMGYVHRQKDQRGMLLVGVSSRVRTALQVTKVDQFFQFADRVTDIQATHG